MERNWVLKQNRDVQHFFAQGVADEVDKNSTCTSSSKLQEHAYAMHAWLFSRLWQLVISVAEFMR